MRHLNHLHSLWFSILLLAVIGVSGCARPELPPVQAPPVLVPPPAAEPVVVEPPASPPPVVEAPPPPFRFSGSPNSHYGKATLAMRPLGDEMYYEDLLRAECREAGWDALEIDPQLRSAARELSRYYGERQSVPPQALLREAMVWAGVGEIAPTFLYYGTRDELNLEKYREFVREWIQGLKQRKPFNVAGVGVFVHQPDPNRAAVSYVTILGVDRRLDLDPIPRVVPLENRFIVRGDTRDSDLNLHFYLDFLGNHIFDAAISTEKGAFGFEVQVPATEAIYHLEITSVEEDGNRVLTSFPLYFKVEPPQEFKPVPDPPRCTSQVDCESIFHQRINELRLKSKTADLIVSEKLVEAARSHASDMLTHHYTSLFDRQGRPVQARVKAMGLDTLQVGEVVDGGYDISAIADHFADSPSLSLFLQNAQISHVGCGVATQSGERNRRYYSVSCMVATLIDSREGAELAAAVRQELNAMRHRAGKPVFFDEPRLQQVADWGLDELLKDPGRAEEIQGEINIEIEKSRLVSTRSIFGVVTVYDLGQLAVNSTIRNVIESDATRIVLAVRKRVAPENPYKGIFLYYIAY